MSLVNNSIVTSALALALFNAVPALADNQLAAEVRAWYDKHFVQPVSTRLDYSGVPAVYVSPFRYQTAEGDLYMADDAAVEEFILGFAASAKEAGLDSATLHKMQVKIINERSALLIADWAMFDSSGQLLSACNPEQYLYTLTRYESGWKVVGEALVDCENYTSVD